MRLARLLALALALAINVLTLAGCGGGGGGNASPGGGDTTAPTVSITAPASGAGVTGTTTVSATASDNVGVTSVELYLNGVLLATLNSAPYSFSWDTTALPIGSHALTAKAYDAAGNVGSSGSVSVTVATPPVIDNVSPAVSITSPASGATVSGTTTVSASASDNVGVTRVEFYLDGALQVTDSSAPFNWNWNTLASTSGSHTLLAKAYDAAGNPGQSAGVVVTVPDTTTPTVSITTPASGASVTGVANVTASASDDVGVSRVEFYVNGVLQGTDTSAPYSFSWDTTALKYGSYTLSAKAYDAANNSSQSTDVTVAGPIRVSMNTTVTGSTAVGAVTLTGIPAADAYGLNFLVTMPNGSSLAFVSTGVASAGSSVFPAGNTIILAGTSIHNGQIMQIGFQNLPVGTVAADISLTLSAVFDGHGVPIQ